MTFVDFGWLMLFLGVGSLGIAVGRRLFRHWFSPLGVYFGMTSGSMVAYHLRLLVFTEVSFVTHAILLTSQLCFMLGTLGALDHVPRRWLTVDPPPFNEQGLTTFYRTTAVLASIGWVLAVMILVGRHGLSSLLHNIWVLQLEFQMHFIGYLNMIGILVLPTFVLKLARQRVGLLDTLLVTGALFGLLLAGIKAYLIYSVITSLFVWAAARPDRFRPVHLLAGLLLMLGFFIIYTSRVDIFVTDKFESQTWFRNFVPLHRPYIYFVGAWPALENIVNGTIPDSPITGFVVLQPLWKLLGDGLGVIDPVPFNLPFTNIGTTFFNVYSMPGEIYWDFGWAGLIILSTFFGAVTARLFVNLRRSGHWAHFMVYGVVSYGVFLAPFVYSYRFNVWVILGYIFAMGFVVLRGGLGSLRPSRG